MNINGGKDGVGDNCTSKPIQGIVVVERTPNNGNSTMQGRV
jgi:hypothetical protein